MKKLIVWFAQPPRSIISLIAVSLLSTLILYGNCGEVSVYELESTQTSSEEPIPTLLAKTPKLKLYTILGKEVQGSMEIDPAFSHVDVKLSLDKDSIKLSSDSKYGKIFVSRTEPMSVEYLPNPGFRGVEEIPVFLHGGSELLTGEVIINVSVYNPSNAQSHYGLAVRATRNISNGGQFNGTIVSDFGLGLKKFVGPNLTDYDPYFMGNRNSASLEYPFDNTNYSLTIDNVGFEFLEETIFKTVTSGGPNLVVPQVYLHTGTAEPVGPVLSPGDAALLATGNGAPADLAATYRAGYNWNREVNTRNLDAKGYNYFDFLQNYSLKEFFDFTTGLNVKEVTKIKIAAPTELRLREIYAQLEGASNVNDYRVTIDGKTFNNVLFVPEEIGVSLPISGISQALNGSVYNDSVLPSQANVDFVCEGDLLILGPARFANINLVSKDGCRIYVTGLITLSAPVNIPSNIQFSSALAISVGMGVIDSRACSVSTDYNRHRRMCEGTNTLKHFIGYSQYARRHFFYDEGDIDQTTSIPAGSIYLNKDAGIIDDRHTGVRVDLDAGTGVNYQTTSAETTVKTYRDPRVFHVGSDINGIDYPWYQNTDNSGVVGTQATNRYFDYFRAFNYCHFTGFTDQQITEGPQPENTVAGLDLIEDPNANGSVDGDEYFTANSLPLSAYILNETHEFAFNESLFTSLSSADNPNRISTSDIVHKIVNDADTLDLAAKEFNEVAGAEVYYPVLDTTCNRVSTGDVNNGVAGHDVFEHVFLNAPIIRSRTGAYFKGMIVGENLSWEEDDSKFNFEEDPIFSVVSLLPLLDFTEEILKVEEN
ncbi:MAG: hypothetical protein HOO06_10515 [Bdellovibrionaceae bacterium]|jgi:hypothetical protein|nr:hypothetical protein [Pseudobdellovibrionaceae bacterium]